MASASASTRSVLQELGDRLSKVWVIPLAAGMVSFGLGLAFLATDWTLKAFAVVTGLAFVLRGLAVMFSPAEARASAGENVGAGLLGVVAGVILIAWPGPTLLVLAFFVGAWLAVSGAFHVVVAIARRDQLPHWVTMLVIGGVELVLGIWAMRRPEATLNLLTALLGIWAVVTGVILVVQAFEIRREARMLRRAAAGQDVTSSPDRLERLRADGLLTDAEVDQLKAAAPDAHRQS